MKPAPFEYVVPKNLNDCLNFLYQHSETAKILAGGQSLIPTMNFRMAQPEYLIDINNLNELSFIRTDKTGGLQMGALIRHHQVENDPLIAQKAPLLHEVMPWIGHVQIRSRGTIGGSLVHADPAAELPSAMVALNARFKVKSKKKERWIPAEQFFVGLFATALEPGEMLVEIAIPAMPLHSGYSFQEYSRRKGDFALVGVACMLVLDKNKVCEQARLVYMGVGEGPVLAAQACQSLVGKTLTPDLLQQAAKIASQNDLTPPNDMHASSAYRRHLAEVLGHQALSQSLERAEKSF